MAQTVYNPPIGTYVPLATHTLTGTDTEILFSSIPSNYQDLVIVFEATGSGDENLTPTINGSSSSFSWIQIASGPYSNAGTNNSIGRIAGSSKTFGMLQFFDYSSASKQKHFLVRTDANGGEMRMLGATWASLNPITSIGLSIRTGFSFQPGSTFAIYGIEA